MSEIDWPALEAAARDARATSHAPYSNYRVGAALLTEDGRVFQGVNVENASYGLCLCAERSAVAAAVTAGVKRFSAIVVAVGGERPAAPCGMCRQVLAEFPPSFPVRCVAEGDEVIDTHVAALLPHGFDRSYLEGEPA